MTKVLNGSLKIGHPRGLAAGIKHMGFVIAKSEWAKMATDEYSESVKGSGEKEGMTTAFFKDVESAKNWFKHISFQQAGIR